MCVLSYLGEKADTIINTSFSRVELNKEENPQSINARLQTTAVKYNSQLC